MRHRLMIASLPALLLVPAGCMSTMAHLGGPSGLEGPFAPYAATRFDLELATAPLRADEDDEPFDLATGLLMVGGAVDAPLSFALDTILLPVDVLRARPATDSAARQDE